MDCYSCNNNCKNPMQGKDVTPFPTTTSPGHPTEGTPPSIKGLGSANLTVTTLTINHGTKGGDVAPGKVGA